MYEISTVLHCEHNLVWCRNLDTLKRDQKYLKISEISCWEMPKISWTNGVRNGEL